MKQICALLLTLLPVHLLSQQKELDYEALKNWPSLQNAIISNTGKYIAYETMNEWDHSQILTIQAVDKKWQLRITPTTPHNALLSSSSGFAANDHFFLMPSGKDSVMVITPGSDVITWMTSVSSLKILSAGQGNRVLYIDNTNPQKVNLVIWDILNNKKRSIPDVKYFDINKRASAALLYPTDQQDPKDNKLCRLDLKTFQVDTVWRGTLPASIQLDQSGQQICMVARDENGTNQLWHYKAGMMHPQKILNPAISQLPPTWQLADVERFSCSDSVIFIIYKKNTTVPETVKDTIKVHIWNYKDPAITDNQSKTMQNTLVNRQYRAIVNLTTKQFYFPENDSLAISAETEDGHWFLLNTITLNFRESYWNKNVGKALPRYLVSTFNGNKADISDIDTDKLSLGNLYNISPDGKYIIFFNNQKNNYCSYHVSTHTTKILSEGIQTSWILNTPANNRYAYPREFIGWIANSNSFLIYDKFDIWLFEADGSKAPVNITHGYGSGNHIIFSILLHPGKFFQRKEALLLSAFNTDTKNNGFFKTSLDSKTAPSPLSMFPRFFYSITAWVGNYRGMAPLKAKDADLYLIKSMTETSAENCYITKDFITFIPISDIHPENRYQYITNTIIQIPLPNNKHTSGLLYKPANFDSTKKYPVILNYYESRSDCAHLFLPPGLTFGDINIPWFVTHGFIVCVPDIEYEIGAIGASALRCVSATADYLSTLPYIDTTKMGLQGHSLGGFETNYIISHTNRFAAACAGAGAVNLLSIYNGDYGGPMGQWYTENSQFRMGGTLWEIPEKYIENSPVFKLDKVQTPLLIMHNLEDHSVFFNQGFELFSSLRKLNKPVWLLEYENEGHILTIEANKRDYTDRLMQFFDTYLRNKPAPLWMTQSTRTPDAVPQE